MSTTARTQKSRCGNEAPNASTLFAFALMEFLRSMQSSGSITCLPVSESGAVPAARWGHTSTVVADRMYLFGGTGLKLFNDLYYLEAGTPSVWQSIVFTFHRFSHLEMPIYVGGEERCIAVSKIRYVKVMKLAMCSCF